MHASKSGMKEEKKTIKEGSINGKWENIKEDWIEFNSWRRNTVIKL